MATRSAPQKQEPQKYWTLIVVICIPIVTFVGGAITQGWTYLDKVATKTLLEERFKDSEKYTDRKTEAVYKDAIEHDEKNRADMLLRTETMMNELKVRNAVVDTKIETLLKATSEIKNITEENQSAFKRSKQK